MFLVRRIAQAVVMSKDEQRSKKGRTGSRATPGKVPADLPDASEPMPTRYQRGKTYARSVFRKGAHDTLAAFVKGGLIAAAGIVASWVGYHYFGHHVDLKGWLSGNAPPVSSRKATSRFSCVGLRERI
jgi:hypothetical protein